MCRTLSKRLTAKLRWFASKIDQENGQYRENALKTAAWEKKKRAILKDQGIRNLFADKELALIQQVGNCIQTLPSSAGLIACTVQFGIGASELSTKKTKAFGGHYAPQYTRRLATQKAKAVVGPAPRCVSCVDDLHVPQELTDSSTPQTSVDIKKGLAAIHRKKIDNELNIDAREAHAGRQRVVKQQRRDRHRSSVLLPDGPIDFGVPVVPSPSARSAKKDKSMNCYKFKDHRLVAALPTTNTAANSSIFSFPIRSPAMTHRGSIELLSPGALDVPVQTQVRSDCSCDTPILWPYFVSFVTPQYPCPYNKLVLPDAGPQRIFQNRVVNHNSEEIALPVRHHKRWGSE
jgi:hypothetical protein